MGTPGQKLEGDNHPIPFFSDPLTPSEALLLARVYGAHAKSKASQYGKVPLDDA